MRLSNALIVLFFAVGLFSFKSPNACLYAESNMSYLLDQTEMALATEDLNMSKYYAYKALNALAKSQVQFEACGCDDVMGLIGNITMELKDATKATTLSHSKIVLKKALHSTLESMEALNKYNAIVPPTPTWSLDQHLLALEEPSTGADAALMALEKKLEIPLQQFKESLNKVVRTVPCPEAHAYAKKVYTRSEKALLGGDLSQEKKLYHYKIKEMAGNALLEIGGCR